MPYIKRLVRKRFDDHIEGILNEKFGSLLDSKVFDKYIEELLVVLCNKESSFQPGELNYIISKLIKRIVIRIGDNINYTICNSILVSLNYIISKLIRGVVERSGISYTLCNGIIGSLQCVIHEFCRRQIIYEKASKYLCDFIVKELEIIIDEFYREIVVPYEDKKIIENGDI